MQERAKVVKGLSRTRAASIIHIDNLMIGQSVSNLVAVEVTRGPRRVGYVEHDSDQSQQLARSGQAERG